MSPLKLAPTAEQEWQQFQDDLSLCLGALEEDEYLIISDKDKNYYVQFAQQGNFGMRCEAAGNAFIEPEDALTVNDYDHMVDIGWQRATDPPDDQGSNSNPDGSPNFFIAAAAPVDFKSVAQIAVQSLREVYEIKHPGELEYKAFHHNGTSIRFPTLRIRRKIE
jgi:hypothetical protein